MDCQDIRDWVFQAVADGASQVFTYIEALLTEPESVIKVNTFIATAKEAEQLLSEGKTRKYIGELVSERGKEKFWSHWPE